MKKSKTLVVFFVFILFSINFTVKGQKNNLDGVWVLEDLELYKYSEKDSALINSKSLAPEFISGVLDTITFSGNIATTNIEGMLTKFQFSTENDILILYMSAIPKEYVFIIVNSTLILFRKYIYESDKEDGVSYGVKLKYKKETV